jgi:hypothetical protein
MEFVAGSAAKIALPQKSESSRPSRQKNNFEKGSRIYIIVIDEFLDSFLSRFWFI